MPERTLGFGKELREKSFEGICQNNRAAPKNE